MHPVGDQVMHLAIGFYHAVHSQHRGAEDLGALLFPQSWPHHCIDKAGFVFQRQEDGAAGGHGALAHRDQAAGAEHPCFIKLSGYNEPGVPVLMVSVFLMGEPS
jgi:hypothetical protein